MMEKRDLVLVGVHVHTVRKIRSVKICIIIQNVEAVARRSSTNRSS